MYWSDVSEKRIYSIHLDGTHKRVFLNSSDGVGTVHGEDSNTVMIRSFLTDKPKQSGPGSSTTDKEGI